MQRCFQFSISTVEVSERGVSSRRGPSKSMNSTAVVRQQETPEAPGKEVELLRARDVVECRS